MSPQWRPRGAYSNLRPARHNKEWQNLDGFSNPTIAIERRNMNPLVDIQSFTLGDMHTTGYVRPIDVKGGLGANPVQDWKEGLRTFGERQKTAKERAEEGAVVQDPEMQELRSILGV